MVAEHEVRRLRQYSVGDLALTADFSNEISSDGIEGVAGPGDASRVIVHTGERIVLLVDGEVAEREVTTGPRLGNRIVAVSDTTAYTWFDFRLLVITLSPSGIESTSPQTRLGNYQRLKIEDDLIIHGDQAISRTTFESRRATEFEQAISDPVSPFRYLIGSINVRDAVKVFDSESGDLVIDRPQGCSAPEFGEYQRTNIDGLVGEGLLVAVDARPGRRGPLAVADIVVACGSYGEFTPVQPDRVYDTRRQNAEPGAGRPLEAGTTRRIEIHGDGGVPEDGVESVVLNVTAVRQRGTGGQSNFITVWSAGFEQPTTANINIANGETVGNMVTVSTAAGGFVDVYSNAGTVDLTVDVMGYFAGSLGDRGARFTSMVPERILDSRLTGQRLGRSDRIEIDLYGELDANGSVNGIRRSETVAAVMNISAVDPTAKGFYRVFRSGGRLPDASSTNFGAGTNTARTVTVPLAAGRFELQNELGSSDVIIDVVGLYVESVSADQSGRFVGLVPFRELDTRAEAIFGGDGRMDEDSAISVGGFVEGVTVVTNLTAIRPTRLGYLSTGPWIGPKSFRTLDDTSSLNFSAGVIIANQAIIRPSTEMAEIAVYNGISRTHVTLDVYGFYTGPGNEFLFE